MEIISNGNKIQIPVGNGLTAEQVQQLINEKIANTVPTIEESTHEGEDENSKWYVRKHSDGYIEMFYVHPFTVEASDWQQSESLWYADYINQRVAYPVALTTVFNITYGFRNYGHGNGAFITQSSVASEISGLPSYCIWRTKKFNEQKKYILNVKVTGKWK